MDQGARISIDSDRSAARPVHHARFLLAEDNPIASDLIAMMVRRVGSGIDQVANGLEAVDAVARAAAIGAPYALLLLDTMMPVLTGVEAARRIRANGMAAGDLPIIAVTAATDPAEVREYLDAGMQGYLAKPVSLTNLAACVEAWAPLAARPRPYGGGAPGPALRRRYELRKMAVIEQFEQACRASHFVPELTAKLREHLHKLAGTAGSFGETSLSDAAAQGEALLIGASPSDVRLAVERSYALLKEVG